MNTSHNKINNKINNKKNNNIVNTVMLTIFIGSVTNHTARADDFTEAMTSSKASINLNLRYESVKQDNVLQDASALTLRTLLTYDTGNYKGFSAKVEMEDTRIVLGQGDYTVGPTGYNPGLYSVIADPEHTELDQGYIQYKHNALSVKLGRQEITMDGQRFVGHVGWRQDRQTFDALSTKYAPSQNLTLQYIYITQRNRIFAQDADLDAKDHLVNAAYKTAYGTLTGYGYLLEADNDTDNALDTFGISFAGSINVSDTNVLYLAEYASQNSDSVTADFNVNYVNFEAGTVIKGITAKVGYEVLGSDGGNFGFSTPLATLHKFNGWSDQFLGTPSQGLVDTSFTLAGQALGAGWKVVYHKFDADDASDTVDDLGSEFNLSYVKKYAEHYTLGIKYAAYSAGDIKVDADKIWLWLGAKF
jgi:hypothetical protein